MTEKVEQFSTPGLTLTDKKIMENRKIEKKKCTNFSQITAEFNKLTIWKTFSSLISKLLFSEKVISVEGELQLKWKM